MYQQKSQQMHAIALLSKTKVGAKSKSKDQVTRVPATDLISMLTCVGNSAFIAVRPHPPNCGIWLAFIAASNTFIVLGVKGWI